MNELNLAVDLVEEQIVRGNLRWLANFNEIHRNYRIEDLTTPLYASGSLQEKGFLLSRVFSALVTPKYKVNLLVFTYQDFNESFVKKLITLCKRKFGTENVWTFLALVQSNPFDKSVKKMIESFEEAPVGVSAYSLESKESVVSNNALGRGLRKQLRLAEPTFEAFDLPDYVKSFTMALFLGTIMLFTMQLISNLQIFSLAYIPITVMALILFSIIAGHLLYKSQYRTTLTMTTEGFELRKGKVSTKRKWAEFEDATIFITPRRETYIRLHEEKRTFDLPLSRVGLSRKDMYNNIKQILSKKEQ
jgi:hypothetical protein